MLPIIQSASGAIEVEERRALIYSFIKFVKETSEQLHKYASRPTSSEYIFYYVIGPTLTRDPAFVLENWYNSKRGKIDLLREKSRNLRQNIDLAISIETREQQLLADRELALNRIKPLAGSSFDPDPKNCCMPDTRADVIERLISFAVSKDTSRRLFFLSGVAGCGKSSVATSVANALRQRGRLSGSFFFKRDSEKLRIPANLLHTVAYSMALRHEPYRKALIGVLKTDATIECEALSIQFDALLRKPLSAMSNISSTSTSDPPSNRAIVVVVIDALDECDDPRSVSSYLAEMVGLAPWLRIIVTSRPLDEIEADLCRAVWMTHLNLFTVNASEDILKFTQSRFAPGGPLRRLRSQVTEEDIQVLAVKSHGLFVWIQTVLSYLTNFTYVGTQLEEMKGILSSGTAASLEKELDQLYLRVLRSVAGTSPDYQDAVKNLVGFIYVTSRNRSLPCRGLHAFIPTPNPNVVVTPEDVNDLRIKLAAVITIDLETEALRVCHPSFLDFVASEARSQEFWTNLEVLDSTMAQRCFSILKAGLKFNICGLESSRLRNNEIPNLKQRIPQELQYSAVYWLDHLLRSSGSNDDEKLNDAYEFLYNERLLYWLEVLSVVSEINAAAQILRKLVVMSKDDHEIYETFQDFLRFVVLLREPMSVSVPHIYISSVIWAEPWSAAMKFLPSELQIVLDGRDEARPANVWRLNVGSLVYCVAYSPDGRQIVTSSMDRTIRIWDSQIGVPLTEPLKGHTDDVSSLAYSPDGTYFISGSSDATVQIWDSQTGVPIREPLKGHTGPIVSVAYSPDGAHIISGSSDMTVRIWDSQTGRLVREPLQGPMGGVTSVAYSPDGAYIICSSVDNRIWMWDSQTGGQTRIFRGHTDSVLSVAYSPDGTKIISGSKDKTIRIWDPQTGSLIICHSNWVNFVVYSPTGESIVSGSTDPIRFWDPQTGNPIENSLSQLLELVLCVAYSPDGTSIILGTYNGEVHICDAQTGMPRGTPLKGHVDKISTIVYSPNGRQILSGSQDKTICGWDSKTGLQMGHLGGHTSKVASIAYSPDGTHFVSASWDETLQMWDSQTGAHVGEPLKGHTAAVTSVAYSPNGRQIISGSYDNTILIWDSFTHATIQGPLRGHTGPVDFVAYSLNGKHIISGSRDNTIIIWDPITGAPSQRPLKGHVVACFPTRFHVALGSDDETVQVWDFQTGKPIYEPLRGQGLPVTAISYSPDGNHIISASHDMTIRIWDSLTGALIRTPFQGHTSIIWAVAFSPDGKHFASGGLDKTIQVWDT
ncbi:WD40 repeat-like protein [Lactarius psammicola]|nr:WD40 repeat-like protein [Lactarius psammicola]